ESLLFELGQARVDGAGARRVGAAGAVRERLHDVVAVARPCIEQIQQIEAQVAVGEDRAHHHSASVSIAASGAGAAAAAARRSTVTSPETELARTSAKLPLSSPTEPVKFVVGPAPLPERTIPST